MTRELARAGFVILAALGFVSAGYSVGLWLRQRIKPQPAAPGTLGRIGWTVLSDRWSCC